LNRGLSTFDVRHKLAISVLYETPRLRGNAFTSFLSAWELGGIAILQSGLPFDVYCSTPFRPVTDSSGQIVGNSGCDYNADGHNYDYPNAPSFGGYLGGFTRSQYLDGIFQASDFAKPLPGQNGTLGRDMYFGPGYANTNFNVVKHFPLHMLGEQGKLDFRAEFFNVFNRVNLSQMSGDLSSSQFGRATTALGGRNVQFGLRLAF
jgi:hypothetical protein